ncbi:MAG: hypothetical protein HKN71_04860 [Gemmatimonadetes bacterium]|nr:hypothetical protein [Gemmatimonadota bacterium]
MSSLSMLQEGPVLDPPRGHLPFASELFTVTGVESMLGAAGDLLWVVTYVIAIWIGFKHRTYAVPLLAVALNVTWEFVYTVIYPVENRVVFYLHAAWLVVDLIIVYQIYRFGRKEQRQAFFRKHYPLLLTLTLAACLIFQITFDRFFYQIALFPMETGNGMAFMMNLVMSILFFGLLFGREDLRGVSEPIAWTKMIGTALISIGNTMAFLTSEGRSYDFQFRPVGSDEAWQAFTAGTRTLDLRLFYFMFIAIFVLDVLYIVMVRQAKRRRAEAEVAG